ncbi:AraC family transcriptional regulator [Solwaraspora sp. WMMA2065]|uniref:AraC family transcriptional regulator n=1 Tax=Solwaraspora sp. WMMA2065 TaxID=3015166 RepID=UPI00259B83F3|nr:AraC family transcriptional regulator [Solwaraspora sp. WMMA2065]WJK36197.1 AraC family transcriptional regulator [Solwaraspora sp. WMMA2065]
MPLRRQGFDGPAGLHEFNSALRHTLVQQTVTIRDPSRFRARITEVPLGSLRLISAAVGALHSSRRPHDTTDPNAADAVFLLLGQRATGTITHRGGTDPIGPDRLVVVPGPETFDVDYPAPAHVLFVALPRALVTARYPGLDGPVRSAMLGPVGRALCRQLPHLMTAAAAAGAGQRAEVATMVDTVITATLFGAGVAVDADPLAALRTAAERLIEHSLAEPALSVPWLARRLAVSPRQLHRAFAAGGTTPYRWIRQRRLHACAVALAGSDVPVAQLAHRYGFASASHLGALFRARYGAPPAQWRSEHRADGPAGQRGQDPDSDPARRR